MIMRQSDGALVARSKQKKPRKYPVEIWAGRSLIRILRDPPHIPIKPRVGEIADPNRKIVKKKYDSYLVEYPQGSKVRRRRRSTYDKAHALADQIKVKLINGEVKAADLVALRRAEINPIHLLYTAVTRPGNRADLIAALRGGAHPNGLPFARRLRPIARAAKIKRLDLVKILIRAGANVHANKESALYYSVWKS